MHRKKLIIQNEHGMHARVASELVQRARSSGSIVTINKDGAEANASSIIELILLGAKKGSEIEISVEGGDEIKNLESISEIFSEGSGI
ncbi:MAG: hypothetical protein ACD_79C00682G0004 [uncultured bacterium]|nr:MAG: hypothetical protein ACD_79C00682G0004 [uncultured bacterium]